MTLPVEFDPAEGRRLASAYEDEVKRYRSSAHEYVAPPVDYPLRQWLWDRRAALIQAALDLPGVYLQLEQRDRVIAQLLQTLSETEARLPGITTAPALTEEG